MLEHQVRKAPMVPPEMLVHQVPMENQEIKDPVDHPVPQARAVPQARKDLLVIPAELPDPNPAQLVPQALLVNPVPQAPLAALVKLVKMEAPAAQELLVMLVLQAAPAKLVAPVPLATPAMLVPLAAANTAHRLVWLQVIKHLLGRKRLGNTFHRQTHDSIHLSSLPHRPKIWSPDRKSVV